jgi:MFS family permease
MNEQIQEGKQAGWGTIILIYLLCVLAASSISQAVPIVGDIARAFHAARHQLGWVISIPSALVAVGALLVGWICDRVGDKRLILIGSGLLALGDLGVILAPTMNELLLMRVVEGVGYVGVAVGTVVMMTRLTQGARRTSALTLWSSFIPMSFVIPLILAGLLAGSGHWRWAFGGHAMITVLLAALALKLPARDPHSTRSRSADLGAVLKTPACYARGVAFAAAAFVQTGITTTLPQALAGHYGIAVAAASQVVTIGMICNFLGCLAMGPMLNRGVRRLPLALGSALLTVAAALVLYIPALPLGAAVASALVFYFGAGLVVGLWALLPLVAPTPVSRGATSGLVTQVTLWGVLFGPPAAFGALASGAQQQQINIAIAMLLCILTLWFVVRSTRERRMRATGESAAAH